MGKNRKQVRRLAKDRIVEGRIYEVIPKRATRSDLVYYRLGHEGFIYLGNTLRKVLDPNGQLKESSWSVNRTPMPVDTMYEHHFVIRDITTHMAYQHCLMVGHTSYVRPDILRDFRRSEEVESFINFLSEFGKDHGLIHVAKCVHNGREIPFTVPHGREYVYKLYRVRGEYTHVPETIEQFAKNHVLSHALLTGDRYLTGNDMNTEDRADDTVVEEYKPTAMEIKADIAAAHHRRIGVETQEALSSAGAILTAQIKDEKFTAVITPDHGLHRCTEDGTLLKGGDLGHMEELIPSLRILSMSLPEKKSEAVALKFTDEELQDLLYDLAELRGMATHIPLEPARRQAYGTIMELIQLVNKIRLAI